MAAENSNDRKLQGTEFCFTNLAAHIYFPKMVAEHFSFTTKTTGDALLSKMPAELPSAEQIFAETSRLVPLYRLIGPGPGCIKQLKIKWEFLQLFAVFRRIFSHHHYVSYTYS